MFKRLAFNWSAQTAHGLHSPFVFDLYTQVIDPIYQSNPTNLNDTLIHGIGKHLKLEAGKLHVIDLAQLQAEQISQIEAIMQVPTQVLIFVNLRHSEECLQNWHFIASKEQAIHSIELFEMGIISTIPIAPKQYFRLKKS